MRYLHTALRISLLMIGKARCLGSAKLFVILPSSPLIRSVQPFLCVCVCMCVMSSVFIQSGVNYRKWSILSFSPKCGNNVDSEMLVAA